MHAVNLSESEKIKARGLPLVTRYRKSSRVIKGILERFSVDGRRRCPRSTRVSKTVFVTAIKRHGRKFSSDNMNSDNMDWSATHAGLMTMSTGCSGFGGIAVFAGIRTCVKNAMRVTSKK